MSTIKAAELATEVSKILEAYRAEVDITLDEAVTVTAKETVKQLRTTSPKRTGDYAKSWTQNTTPYKKGAGYMRVVYAKAPHYRLTHLLENGHLTRDGKRTRPQEHIAPAAEAAERVLLERLTNGIDKIK